MALVRLSLLSTILHVLPVSLWPLPHTLLGGGGGEGPHTHILTLPLRDADFFFNVPFWGCGCEFTFSVYIPLSISKDQNRFIILIPSIHQSLLFGPGFQLGLLHSTLAPFVPWSSPYAGSDYSKLRKPGVQQQASREGVRRQPLYQLQGRGPHKSPMKQGPGTRGCWWHPVYNRLHSMMSLPPRASHFYFWHNACQLSISSGNFCFLAL